MKIYEICDNKKKYIDLLLLADEQEDMIDLYLDRGRMFVIDDNGVKAECVVTDEGEGVIEIKNIATDPEFLRQGYARKLIDFVAKEYAGSGKVLQVGTGDCTSMMSFYGNCGFKRSHVLKNFFTDNYDHEMFEDGVQLVDMVFLRKEL